MTRKNMMSAWCFLLLTLGIFGLVYNPSFGIPNVGPFIVPGVSVHAHNTNGFGSQYANTNTTGQYLMNRTLTDVGIYTVEASANGYVKANVNTTVSSLSDIRTVDIVLNRSGIIEGKIFGKDGHTVVGAVVTLYQESSPYFPVDETRTDANGMYYFATDVETGVYYVRVSFDFSTLFGWYQDAPYLANGYVEGKSQNIVATQGVINVAPDVFLNQSGVITGTVKDGLGHPIANATVSASTYVYPSSYYISTIADSNGVYRISYDVVNGTYTVTPNASGFVGDSADVVATQTGTVTQDFTMLKTATLTGNVWRKSDNKPVPEVHISLLDDQFKYFGYDTTNATGSYAINDGLGPGNYTVTAELGGTTVNTTRITLAAGESKTLDFKIDAYFISGIVYANVTGGSTLPYPNVQLTFSDPTPADGSTEGDGNGNYVLVLPIVPGTGGSTYNGNFTVSAFDYNTTIVNANIVIGTDISNEDFALPKSPPPPPHPPSATIEGTIYGNSGPDLPFSYQWWHLSDSTYGYQFMVGLNTSSHIDFVFPSLSTKSIYISVWGPEGTTGQMTIWIPNAIYQGSFSVTSSPGPNPTMGTVSSNGTYWIVPMTYGHSSKYIFVQSTNAIPEFQAPIALMTVLLSIALAAFLQKRRRFQANWQEQTSQ
jgi:hypothetical protein